MPVDPCARCETDAHGVRIDGYCPWCYAVVKNRPGGAVGTYGPITDWQAENPQKRKCPRDCDGVMEWEPHHFGRDWGGYVCRTCNAVVGDD